MQKILILGATSPIARALALKFAYDGARLYLAARDAQREIERGRAMHAKGRLRT